MGFLACLYRIENEYICHIITCMHLLKSIRHIFIPLPERPSIRSLSNRRLNNAYLWVSATCQLPAIVWILHSAASWRLCALDAPSMRSQQAAHHMPRKAVGEFCYLLVALIEPKNSSILSPSFCTADLLLICMHVHQDCRTNTPLLPFTHTRSMDVSWVLPQWLVNLSDQYFIATSTEVPVSPRDLFRILCFSRFLTHWYFTDPCTCFKLLCFPLLSIRVEMLKFIL